MKIVDIVSESKKKNCGCGKDPCETYGTQQESKDDYKPHMMYKGSKKDYRAKYPTKKKHHDSLMNRGYNHDDPETDKVEERYGMRQGGAGARSANATAINQTKRANNRAQNQGREDRIAQQQDFIKNKRRSTKIPTGLVQRQQAQAPVQQS